MWGEGEGEGEGGGKVIEICARKNINVKEMRVSISPLGRVYLGKRMAFSHFTVKIYDGASITSSYFHALFLEVIFS